MWRCEGKTAKTSLRRRSLKAHLHRLRFICVIVAADVLAQSHVVMGNDALYIRVVDATVTMGKAI